MSKGGRFRLRDWKRIVELTKYALIGERRLDYVFIHHTVTGLPPEYPRLVKTSRSNKEGKKRRRFARRRVKAIEREHMRTLESIALNRGFAGISYTLVHFPSGHVYKGRTFARVGAHTLGYNETGYGLVAIGNYEIETPTTDLLEAIIASISKGKKWGRIAKEPMIRGHRDVGQTACPGTHLYARLPYIRIQTMKK